MAQTQTRTRPRLPVQPRPRGRSQGQRDARTGFLLVLPALAFVAVFALYPLVFGAYISLTNWPLVGAYHFIGFANYVSLIHNAVFVQSILFTLEYTAIVTSDPPGRLRLPRAGWTAR